MVKEIYISDYVKLTIFSILRHAILKDRKKTGENITNLSDKKLNIFNI